MHVCDKLYWYRTGLGKNWSQFLKKYAALFYTVETLTIMQSSMSKSGCSNQNSALTYFDHSFRNEGMLKLYCIYNHFSSCLIFCFAIYHVSDEKKDMVSCLRTNVGVEKAMHKDLGWDHSCMSYLGLQIDYVANPRSTESVHCSKKKVTYYDSTETKRRFAFL